MNLQQLRYLNEIVRCNLDISDAANAFYTSKLTVPKYLLDKGRQSTIKQT